MEKSEIMKIWDDLQRATNRWRDLIQEAEVDNIIMMDSKNFNKIVDATRLIEKLEKDFREAVIKSNE